MSKLKRCRPTAPSSGVPFRTPDVYFQAREAVNSYYLACPAIVQNAMDRFADLTGRQYGLCDYVGSPDAEQVVVIMGSGAEVAHEAVEYLASRGEKVGVIKVRLYRPFSAEQFVCALPPAVKSIAVLDRTKEAGAIGEPLYQDVVTALHEVCEGPLPRVIGGRYGLLSKEFTPAMVKGIFDELAKTRPKNHFTVRIVDDVTHTSLDYAPEFSTEDRPRYGACSMAWGPTGPSGPTRTPSRS